MIVHGAALVLALALGGGSGEELAATTVGALRLKVPTAWQRRPNEGTTTRFAAPTGEAYFDVDVGRVQRDGGMPASECLQKILAGLGDKGFEFTSIGGQPAAFRQYVDKDSQGKKFVQVSYVGCNGEVTWSMQFHMVQAKRDRFGPLAEKVSRSIEYQK